MAWGEGGRFGAASVDTASFSTVEAGRLDEQLYAQITFRFLDLWLGLVMVLRMAVASRMVLRVAVG